MYTYAIHNSVRHTYTSATGIPYTYTTATGICGDSNRYAKSTVTGIRIQKLQVYVNKSSRNTYTTAAGRRTQQQQVLAHNSSRYKYTRTTDVSMYSTAQTYVLEQQQV
jgi:hypothetical protein